MNVLTRKFGVRARTDRLLRQIQAQESLPQQPRCFLHSTRYFVTKFSRFLHRRATATAAPAANSASVPGSGTGAIAAPAEAAPAEAGGDGTTGAGKAVGSPTVKSVPSAIASLLVTISVPLLTDVPPR